ncbi:Rdx family-domain-containing protein [Dichotomopilus funicola]|uniref:Rdx family-domain-containing protein n=1 Tax=Dichotomopilus funicola TaxID=1934379 RepID=A0AAN6ZQV2_9PEZI|nr:Rdx family-domain-containing protein [Dichotomopilus funicola]
MAEPVIEASLDPRLPRVTIQFCTQCKWMLRAAYYAQELLSTFSLSLGEVSLQPATGGIFLVEITTSSSSSSQTNPTATAAAPATTTTSPPTSPPAPTSTSPPAAKQETPTTPHLQKKILWDRKIDGGFPETKELKRRVRDVIQPGRDLGHVDRDYAKGHVRGKSSVEEGVTTKGEVKGVEGEGKEGKKQEGGSGSTQVEREKGKGCGVEKCEDCE